MKRISIIFLAIILSILMVACNNNNNTNDDTPIMTDNGLTLELKEDNTYTVISCNSKNSKLSVPETHDGIQITSISTGAFDNCNTITNISIPKTITKIERGALKGCSELAEITVPFVGPDLTGGSFGYIFGEAVPDSLKKVAVTGGTKLSALAFENCYDIENIALPDTLTEIGEKAFLNCRSLKNIVIPDGVTKIGDYVLKGCTHIESITAPLVGDYDGGTISDFFHEYRSALGTWDVPSSLKSVTLTKVTRISYFMFNDCENVKTITLPTTLQEISGTYYTLPHNFNGTIYYQGTKAQWEAIEKEDDWDISASYYTVICSDGTI